jgi:signal transduction histidine kinase
VLVNVIQNAIQQIGQIEPRRRGRVGSESPGQPGGQKALQVSIEDDGPGIHRRLWERIFEMDYTTRCGDGSGLGLYLSRTLIEAQGGRLYVANSHLLRGTRFVVELPARI